MMTNTLKKSVFVRRLGLHHFAHLRAFSEGLDVQASARRYLGIEHGHEAKTAHTQTVDAVRMVARRRGEKAWRLIGLRIAVNPRATEQPNFDDFIAEHDLDGWSAVEVEALYLEAYPPNPKNQRREKLRARQLQLLKTLEGVVAETPLPSDLVSGWFDDLTAAKLISAGMVTLFDLGTKLAVGGTWYSALPAVGRTKALRIKHHFEMLLPQLLEPKKAAFALVTNHALFAPVQTFETSQSLPALPHPALPALTNSMLSATSDFEAVESWIAARAGSQFTATTYRREAMRLLLWLQYECLGKTLSNMNVDDCGNFMAFLQAIPAHWISRVHAKPGAPGWAPFRGPLSRKSQTQAIVIVASLFTWLQSARYLPANPWLLMNQKTGDDASEKMLDTKAFSEGAVLEILKFIGAQPPSPSSTRMRFILRFLESVDLRSAELLNAKLEDFRLEPEGWVMQVHGKGAKNRIAAVPGQAYEALQEYLELRGVGSIQSAPPKAPLLASTLDPMEPIGYQALYEHVKGWFSKAISASALPLNERLKLTGASTHWLRHTFGTRAIARDVPLDVIQAQMGHASIQTTTAIYGRAPIRRRVDELGKAFG
ncbi:MAG: tyrosine-type recombinase/integrase [Rhodoferax sp.]|jgi:site-specific recombinase XerD|nr:tyrosine-type recombinase/integrase [Rhodoferax sp.]